MSALEAALATAAALDTSTARYERWLVSVFVTRCSSLLLCVYVFEKGLMLVGVCLSCVCVGKTAWHAVRLVIRASCFLSAPRTTRAKPTTTTLRLSFIFVCCCCGCCCFRSQTMLRKEDKEGGARPRHHRRGSNAFRALPNPSLREHYVPARRANNAAAGAEAGAPLGTFRKNSHSWERRRRAKRKTRWARANG